MKRIAAVFSMVFLAVFLITGPVAFAAKSCGQLKSEVAAKLKKKGVKNYTLDIIPASQTKGKKIIGSCDGGRKKIADSRK